MGNVNVVDDTYYIINGKPPSTSMVKICEIFQTAKQAFSFDYPFQSRNSCGSNFKNGFVALSFFVNFL